MTVTDRAEAAAGLRVTFEGASYLAEPIAGGAAFALLADQPLPGFRPNPEAGAPPYRRFVHRSEVTGVTADYSGGEEPLRAPVSRYLGWADLHRLSQLPLAAQGTPGAASLITGVRASATVRRGTRMLKVLSPAQLAGCLAGWRPAGFCYREFDVAHLRTPDELRLLRTDADDGLERPDVAYVLRWRAVDPADYEIPSADAYPGLVAMPPHDRLGPPVLGTGFTPSQHHLIPEVVTVDVADVPLSANAGLAAFLPDGTEVPLYAYGAEQRGWVRMAGPRWRHLLTGIEGIAPDQEYVPRAAAAGQSTSRLLGLHDGQLYEVIADPPDDFRVLAMSRAARFPVRSLVRRMRYAQWRGVRCTVGGADGAWARVRVCRPDPETVPQLGARCVERGVYETWAPATELIDLAEVELAYSV